VNKPQLTRIATQFQGALSEEELTAIGRDIGFTERLREVTPFRLALAAIGAMACQQIETIADLQRSFRALTGRNVEYKPFHNQLAKDTFPVFMLAVFERLLGRLAVRTLAPVPGHALRRFKDIVIQDGSSFAIHDALESVFPGRFTATNPAAVELHATMSVMDGQPLRVSIAPDAQGERDFLPAPEELRDRLFLADRGYMDIDFCAAVAAAGGSFIVRFSRSANPTLVGGTIASRRLRPRLLGTTLKDCAKALEHRSADLDVEWVRDGQQVPLRLVLIWNDQMQEHMMLVTNLPRKDFRAKSVRCLYRLRWQVELLFKEWKSYANLKPYCTRKAPIAEGLIWAALCAALLKRFLAQAAQVVSDGVEVSTRIAAMALSYHLPRLLDAMLSHDPISGPLESLLEFLATTCRRAHPSRDRRSGRLASGLRPTHLNSRLATCVAKD
jgi:hypothetical protein